ncbi:MAG: hypothetical protein WEC58_01675, partial [Candidatus Paceibacterota bacterium]
MINLLPESEKKRVRREYNVRRMVVVVIFACVTGVIVGIALLPSYMHVQARKQALSQELDHLERSTDSKRSQEYAERLERANQMISILTPHKNYIPAYVLIENLVDNLTEEVRLRGMSYERKITEDGERSILLSVTGVAADRDALTAL